mmetsp:Transcript_26552/g.72874  ORF Transcript_26552/g.72874 Transcript_26552/m.72874 type:complete len:206 (+) Transcript_26552:687-1304(+)
MAQTRLAWARWLSYQPPTSLVHPPWGPPLPPLTSPHPSPQMRPLPHSLPPPRPVPRWPILRLEYLILLISPISWVQRPQDVRYPPRRRPTCGTRRAFACFSPVGVYRARAVCAPLLSWRAAPPLPFAPSPPPFVVSSPDTRAIWRAFPSSVSEVSHPFPSPSSASPPLQSSCGFPRASATSPSPDRQRIPEPRSSAAAGAALASA